MNEEPLFDGYAGTGYGANRFRFVVVIVMFVACLAWGLIAVKVRKPSDTTLPPKPYSKADMPVLKRNLTALKEDAGLLLDKRAQLERTPDGRTAVKFWEEIFYTPEHYPAFVQNRNVEMARVLELQPGLAKFISLAKEYQDARYAIVTNAGLADKAAAIAALDKRLQPQFKSSDYDRDRKTFDAARNELFGDAQFDHAREAYQKAYKELALKHHPELGGYFERAGVYDAGYAYLMSKAKALSVDMDALEIASSK